MLKKISTQEAPPPFSAYAQGIEVPAGARTLHVSGQVGVTPDGVLADGEEAQHEQTWRNILAILAAGGMTAHDIVSITGFITQTSGVPLFRQVRDRMLDGAETASTLVHVSGLADPSWLVEIAVIAAKVDHTGKGD